MRPETYSLVISLHGMVAVLGAALLIHPLVTLRRRRGLSRRTVQTADIAAVLIVATYAAGWWIYPTYRAEVKPDLMGTFLPAALRFESKEHVALMAAALAVGGALVLRLAGRTAGGRTAAWWLLAGSVLCTAVTSALGVYVRAVAQPGW